MYEYNSAMGSGAKRILLSTYMIEIRLAFFLIGFDQPGQDPADRCDSFTCDISIESVKSLSEKFFYLV